MQPPRSNVESLDLATLLALAERIAVERAGGHFTLMRFTTGWKCMLGTPDLDGDGRGEVAKLPAFQSAREALTAFIVAR
ncbi:hypothetical protein HMI49_28475 [Corallococcus exercitus]|uniref:Uncharacterized protein n=1 Tax=Corallococcus exercitus TaxID=2316736 RepID=A0A7Y4KQ92_9BACT|nr:hypothetical protein [Corallococcus exercitus]NOK37139.1 hypothetical protein [Corallococcus exercitus]